jgi:hypothetical protein
MVHFWTRRICQHELTSTEDTKLHHERAFAQDNTYCRPSTVQTQPLVMYVTVTAEIYIPVGLPLMAIQPIAKFPLAKFPLRHTPTRMS